MSFTYVNSNSDCPENTGLGFAEWEEATAIVPSVARRRAFRRRRQLPFQLVVLVREWKLPSTTPKYKWLATPNGYAVRARRWITRVSSR